MAEANEAGLDQSTERLSTLDRRLAWTKTLTAKTAKWHDKTPVIRKLPFSAVLSIVLLIAANICVWIVAGLVLHFHASLIYTAVLSYTLGLRHALDADHISVILISLQFAHYLMSFTQAIDLMTRRLIASGRPSPTVGLFFSLGHSTIVIITSIVVAATASAVSKNFGTFSQVGGIIGTSVSAAFLILLGLMNAYILYKLVVQLRKIVDEQPDAEESFKIQGAGCLFNVFRKLFKLVDRPWKMYPIGVLFGLGFDTSSEIALLGISSIEASRGTSLWLILIFPCLFTAGMALLDTTDGALMLALYSRANLGANRIATLYYGCVLTAITVVVAVVIGTLQLLSLVDSVASPNGKFWKGVETASDHYDIIGGAICASFAVFGGLSVAIYGPWRRHIDRSRQQRAETGTAALQNLAIDDRAHSHLNEGVFLEGNEEHSLADARGSMGRSGFGETEVTDRRES